MKNYDHDFVVRNLADKYLNSPNFMNLLDVSNIGKMGVREIR